MSQANHSLAARGREHLALDREAAGRTLFVETFAGTLTLFPDWDDQPLEFRSDLCDKAERVAMAALHLGPPPE